MAIDKRGGSDGPDDPGKPDDPNEPVDYQAHLLLDEKLHADVRHWGGVRVTKIKNTEVE